MLSPRFRCTLVRLQAFREDGGRGRSTIRPAKPLMRDDLAHDGKCGAVPACRGHTVSAGQAAHLKLLSPESHLLVRKTLDDTGLDGNLPERRHAKVQYSIL